MSLSIRHHINSFVRNLMESHGLSEYEATLALITHSVQYLYKLKGGKDGLRSKKDET